MGTKTALEWLWEQIPFEYTSSRSAFDVYQQAKELEEQQIISSYCDGYKNGQADWGNGFYKTGEDYYTQTYGGGNE